MPHPTDQTDSTDRSEHTETLLDEFLARVRNGEAPSIDDYVAKLPHQADQLREMLKTAMRLEGLTLHDHSERRLDRLVRGETRRIGDYTIQRELGRGGMGIVYEAVQESLQRRVALKVLSPHIAGSPRQLQRFRREAESAARLHHTNIVPVFGIGESDGLHFYAMQLIEGTPLASAIDTVKSGSGTVGEAARSVGSVRSDRSDRSDATLQELLPAGCHDHRSAAYVNRIAELAVQVADAVSYAHQQGVLHRDLKPSNLMLDAAGTVWVMDFGLARAIDHSDVTMDGDVVGTLRYMAPEQFEGQTDARSDIYSLGLTICELLTLQPVYSGTAEAALQRKTHVEIPRPSHLNACIPRDLDTILLKATQSDPAARYPTALELADDLRRFSRDEPIAARRTSLTERTWRWSRRNPVIAGATSIVAALLVFIAINEWRSRVQLESALDQTTMARNRAEANVRLATDAFDSLLQSVMSRGLPTSLASDGRINVESSAIQAPLTPADAELLDQLLNYYEAFVNENKDDQRLLLRTADAHETAAGILVRLGRLPAAESSLLAARNLVRQQREAAERDPLLTAREVSIVNQLGELSLRQGLFARTLDLHEEAMRLIDAEGDPSLPECRYQSARSRDLAASIDLRSGSNEGPGGEHVGPIHGPTNNWPMEPPREPPPFGDPREFREPPPPPFDDSQRHDPPGFPPGAGFDFGPPPHGHPPLGRPPFGPPPDGPHMGPPPHEQPGSDEPGVRGPDAIHRNLAESRQLFDELHRQFPDERRYSIGLLHALRHACVMLAPADPLPAAGAWHSSVETAKEFAASAPSDPVALAELDECYLIAGKVLDAEQALPLVQSVVARQQLQVAQFPNYAEARLRFGTAMLRAGELHVRLNRNEDAIASLTAAIEQLSLLADQFPDQGIVQIPLARAAKELGVLKGEAAASIDQQLAESADALSAAVTRFEQFLELTPEDSHFCLYELSELLEVLAATRRQQGMSDEAASLFQRAAAARKFARPPLPR